MKDYYKTLNISYSASIAEIKKAYRALAFKYHPDKNPGDPVAEARFREIQEAYETLANSTRKAAYDDERWMSRMGGRTKPVEVVTPAWLVNVCVQLNASLASMDTHRMSQRALQAYILLILEDAHLEILRHYNDRSAIQTVIAEILKAALKLDTKYLEPIEARLVQLAADDQEMLEAIDAKMDERIRKALMERFLPYFIILVTLVLCLCMYYYGALR